ncbi:protein-tyrosine phosphatase family protein [Halosegnis longus]|uniref:Phosphatase n=1 Tax=Halosegnis longus TaxID=2216012 RepID=A0AAJ4R8B3_9EURY|nr:dual specificity protein phosphatase family protein [Halosegnis longus]RNJ26050.1 phosphatase [Salella cibi]
MTSYVSSNLAARPLGYAADGRECRRLTETLFLGNRAAPDHSFDAVVSLTADPTAATTHHHPLVDGPGNDYADFAAAVETTHRLTHERDSVLVHCRAGVSRSTAVAATVIATRENRGFHEAFGLVAARRRVAVAHPALCLLGVCYLAAN